VISRLIIKNQQGRAIQQQQQQQMMFQQQQVPFIFYLLDAGRPEF
jgi:hypothetical protein